MLVLVTRAQPDAERTAAVLSARGHEALIAPVIRIVPTGHPAPAGAWDALIVTSLHASEALATLPDRHVPVFAVGPRTGRAVRDLQFTDVRVADGDAASLSVLIRRDCDPGASLLHITARHHKDEPARSLRAAGYPVSLWEAYEAEAQGILSAEVREAIRGGRIGGALHYSRRSAELFLAGMSAAGLVEKLVNFPHFCLSDDVAVPLQAHGLEVRIADAPDESTLLRLLDS